MQVILLVTVALHVLTGVFWAGTTFALARTGAVSAASLFRPQMGAAAVAVIAGGVLVIGLVAMATSYTRRSEFDLTYVDDETRAASAARGSTDASSALRAHERLLLHRRRTGPVEPEHLENRP